MKEKMKNKKIWILICSIILVVAIAGTAIWFLVKDTGENKNPNGDKNTTVDSEKEQDREDGEKTEENSDDKIMIIDCDSVDIFEESQNILLVEDEGLFKQGTGAFMNASTSSVFCAGKLKESVDISKLKGGYLHFSCYISSKANLKNDLVFELSSSGVYDKKEMQWTIELSKVQEGWNEIYVPVPSAVTTGKVDMTAINYFRFYSPELDVSAGSMDVIIDDISLTKKKGETTNNNANTNTTDTPSTDTPSTDVEEDESSIGKAETDSYRETTTSKGKMIASFNTKNIFAGSKHLLITTQPGEYVEGSGAMKVINSQVAQLTWKTPVDLSEYMVDSGVLHISVYVNDPKNLGGLTYFTLSSSGDTDEQSFYWYLDTYVFKAGWNEIELPFYQGMTKRRPNMSAITLFRFQTKKPSEQAVIILDNMYVTK